MLIPTIHAQNETAGAGDAGGGGGEAADAGSNTTSSPDAGPSATSQPGAGASALTASALNSILVVYSGGIVMKIIQAWLH
ncbi:hypothetical protein Ahia01_000482600 [Argonauta hians]